MRKPFVYILFLALTACAGGASQYQLNRAMQKADQAAANCGMTAMPTEISSAWETVRQLTEKQCPKGSNENELPPEEREKASQCWKALVKEHINPVTTDKKELDKFISKQDRIAANYKEGSIDRKAANAQTGQAWTEYAVNEMSYFKLAQCQNAALLQHVMPVYHNKGILADFLAKRSEVALNVDEGKLTPEKAEVKIQKALAELAGAEQQANTAIAAQNAQAWRDYSVRMQQFSAQVMQAEAQAQAAQPQSRQNTNCHFIGNQMNCTTW